MNCQDLERLLLLDQYGELPAFRHNDLTDHLAACPACKARQSELASVTGFLKDVTAASGPSEAVIARILAAARTGQPIPRRLPLRLPWARAMAAAAALALLLGLAGLTLWRPSKNDAPLTDARRVAEVASLLAMLMEHNADAVEAHAAATAGDLQGFARQLLIMEGFNDEADDEWVDDATRLEERQPTTLQWRSSPAAPARICG